MSVGDGCWCEWDVECVGVGVSVGRGSVEVWRGCVREGDLK